MSIIVLIHTIKWCAANRLCPEFRQNKYNKLYNNSPQHALHVGYNERYIQVSVNLKMICLEIGENLKIGQIIIKEFGIKLS
jgi:hypothetical protein